MNSLTRLLLPIVALMYSGIAIGQTITMQETTLFSKNQTGYSILNVADPATNADNYLLAGTLVGSGSADSTDLQAIFMDDNGNILWERTYDSGDNERCLSVDFSPNGYVLTGYVDTGQVNNQVFLLEIDPNGNILNEGRFITSLTGHTQGLSVKSTLDGGFIVTGFLADGYLNNDPKKAFLLKTNSSMIPLWSHFYDTPWDINRDLDMGESVIEIPGQGYFFTGSVNLKKHQFNSPTHNHTDQGVLAMMVDLSGNLLWNSSHSVQDTNVTGHWNVGVKPYFDSGSNLIYLMSNNTQAHQFNITVFDLAGNIVNFWDYNFLLNGIAGFDLIESNDPNTLIACALATYYDFQVGSTWYSFNYPPVLLEFNKSDGSQVWSRLYKVPSESYGSFPQGTFTPLAGQQPEIFTPNMVAHSRDGGYAIAANRSNASSYFDLELIKTGGNGWVDCPNDTLAFPPLTLTRYISDSVEISSWFIEAPVSFTASSLPYTTEFCAEPDTCFCEIDPWFSATTNDSCTWQFTDLSYVDSCYDICTWSWDFGDGSTSSLQNPTHVYDTIGWHSVCLNMYVCGNQGVIECDSVICRDIYVSCDTCACEFEPAFTFTTTDSCSFQFTDQSLLDTCYDICSWGWDFGDGGTSTSQNPTYSYSTSSNGWQTVCLSMTACDSLQNPTCDTLICEQVYVSCDTCICEIDPAFTYTTQDSCTFQFTDQSWVDTCFSICTWNWNFGDGNTSNSPNPAHTYYAVGWQTVCLQVSACDPFGITGCDTMICMDVYVECDTCECEIVPGFDYVIDYDSCAVSFIDQSHMADTCYDIWAWHWDFGDGNNSSNQNPTHNYAGSGTYTVCQTIYAGTPGTVGCDTTFCQDIYLNCDTCICEINPGFTYTVDQDSCIVCFEDESTVDTCVDIVGRSWDLFGDGTVYTDSMPCVEYTVNGTYTICLTVSAVANNIQCDTTYCEDIDIHCCDTVLGITEFGPPLDVVVYPNPFSEMTTVQLSRNLDNGTLMLYDLYGRKVDEMRLQKSVGIVNRNNLSDGMYSLVILEGGRIVFKGKLAIH